MTTVRVTEFDNAPALVLSKEILDQLGVGAGDVVQVVPTDDGVNLKRCDSVIQQQMDVAKRVMDKRRDVLRRLAE